MKSKLFHSALIGIFVGLLISSFFSLEGSNYYPLSPFSPVGQFFSQKGIHPSFVLLYSMSCWALIGIFFSLSHRIFEKNWSLLRMSLTHYTLTLLGFFPISLLAGWFTWRPAALLGLVLTFSLVYLIIWSISYAIEWRKIQKINRELEKRQK